MTPKIAFLGLGAMGARMAANLLDAGFQVTVWNRTPERAAPFAAAGATAAATPRDVAAQADIVIAMLRDDKASREVWLDPETGALGGMADNAIAVECSTLSLDHVKVLSKQISDRGMGFIDAPLAGSRPQAEARQLIFLSGGSERHIARVRPALDAMGAATHHAGAVGAGAALKLAVNTLLAIQVAGMAELLGLLERHDIALDRAVDILGQIPVTSPAAKAAAAGMLAESFAPMFPVELVEKDLAYTLAAAPAPMANAAREVMGSAISAGYGSDNLTGVVRLYRKG